MIVKDLQRKEYIFRINKVLDYIDENMSSKFSLDELASVANFSKFHFHRIFKGIINETLSSYILRIRLERAATILIYEPNKPITDIVFDCGFSSLSVFARAFKERFGLNASAWRDKKIIEFSNTSQMNSNSSELSEKLNKYFGDVLITNDGETKIMDLKEIVEPKKIEVKNINEFTVVYIRYIGSYKGNSELFENLFTRLFNWAMPRNLCVFPQTKSIVCLS